MTSDGEPPMAVTGTVVPCLASRGEWLVVTSDVHLGSAYAQSARFRELIERLQPGVALALAGDVLDNPRHHLAEFEQSCLDALEQRAAAAPVFWIIGNHDDTYAPPERSQIRFCRELVWNGCLSVVHGDRFDNLMPRNRWFIRCFRMLHALRLHLGAPPLHVAVFAKRFGLLYRFLCNHVTRNAVEHAHERGLTTIACGHVHQAADRESEGVRYVNLGAWTEREPHCLLVAGERMRLFPVTAVLTEPDFVSVR